MLKIEEYFLAPCTLRGERRLLVSPTVAPQQAWNELAALWRDVLTRSGLDAATTLRFGVMGEATDGTMSYAATVVDRPGLPETFSTITFEGGYYLFAEHVGGPETLNDSARWFYDTYLPSAPYEERHGPRLQLLDARFSESNPSSVLSFGCPVSRLS